MPGTPEKKRKFSRRAWDGAIRQWKLRVHAESRKVMENSSQTGHHHMVESSTKTKSYSDVKTDQRVENFADENIDNNRGDGFKKEQGDEDFSPKNSEDAEGATGDIMRVKLEYKPSVEGDPLHAVDDPKEEEAVESRKAEKVKIITI